MTNLHQDYKDVIAKLKAYDDDSLKRLIEIISEVVDETKKKK